MINSGKEWSFMDEKELIVKDMLDCFDYAKKHHEYQMYGNLPYIFHLKKVYDVAVSCGYIDVSILKSCLLHDVIEDTDVTYEDVKNEFGEEVAEIVYCVTDELGRDREERKSKTYPKIYNNPKAIVVKLCDRISNITESMSEENYNVKKMLMYLREDNDFSNSIRNDDYLDLTSNCWSKYDKLICDLKEELKKLNGIIKNLNK